MTIPPNYQEIRDHLSKDDRLSGLVSSFSLWRPPRAADPYEDLLSSIVSQQLSTKVARVIHQRFLALYGGLPPEPHELLDTPHEVLRSAGLSNQKANYMLAIAEYFQHRSRDISEWIPLEDEAIIKELVSIKGVGRWTAQMILMFTFERPDVFPVDDYGIQMAMSGMYGISGKGASFKKALTEKAESWRPWRTAACRYLWHWKDNAPA